MGERKLNAKCPQIRTRSKLNNPFLGGVAEAYLYVILTDIFKLWIFKLVILLLQLFIKIWHKQDTESLLLRIQECSFLHHIMAMENYFLGLISVYRNVSLVFCHVILFYFDIAITLFCSNRNANNFFSVTKKKLIKKTLFL